MWPTALAKLGIGFTGRIRERAEPGRAVARLTDLGHGQALRELVAEPPTDQRVPDRLVHAVIEVLNDWRPQVDGIVVVESQTRPTLTTDLADGLSRFLKRPVVGHWAIADPTVEPGQGAMNSAQRVAAVHRRFRLEADVPTGPVLLVDDQVGTGWTLTLAAAALREAGAIEVLPLVLATRT
jgi:ATP-dependent DNA helicase RecQ